MKRNTNAALVLSWRPLAFGCAQSSLTYLPLRGECGLVCWQVYWERLTANVELCVYESVHFNMKSVPNLTGGIMILEKCTGRQ